MNKTLSTVKRFIRAGLNISWKLCLAVIAVVMIIGYIVVTKAIKHDELFRDSSQLSLYIKECKKDGYVSIYNEREKKFTLERLEWISHGAGDDRIAVYCKAGKRGFFNIDTGEALCEPTYDKAWNFNEGIAAVEQKGYVSFVDKELRPISQQRVKVTRASDYNWPEAIKYQQGQCLLRISPDSVGVLNTKGQWIITPDHQYISALSADSCRVVTKNDKVGVVSYDGHVLINPVYDAVRIIAKGAAVVAKDGYQKEISYDGAIIYDYIFDNVFDFPDAVTDLYERYEVNNKIGVLRKRDCAVIIPAIYESVEYLSGDYFRVQLPEDSVLVSSRQGYGYAPSSFIILDKNNHIVNPK
jgi:hypothetical protein